MELNLLKEQIQSGTVDGSFKIFVYEDNSFLVNQYVDAIADVLKLNKNYITSLPTAQVNPLDLVIEQPLYLSVMHTDTLAGLSGSPESLENTIVVCSKVDTKAKSELSPFITYFPKLKDWQVVDYIVSRAQGLSREDANQLYQITGGDIYSVSSELDKITIFSPSEQTDIFNGLQHDPNSSLYQISNYTLSDLIVKRDKLALSSFMQHRQAVDIDTLATVNIMLSTFKKILFVNFNSGANLEQLGISQKQANAIKYYYKNFKLEYVAYALDFLSSIDLKLKQGKLDMPKDMLFDYVLGKLEVQNV